jgi:hypothetical protein
MRDRYVAVADGLLGCAVVVVACVVYLSGVGGAFALNSDIVMPYVVYADAIAGEQALSGWMLPESPYWFPDLLVTWALRSVMPLLAAVNAFAMLQIGAWLLLARWVLGQVAPRTARLAWLLFVLAWLALVLIALQQPDSWLDRLAQYLFVPSTHAAALLATLASLGLVLRMQRAPRDRSPAVLLIALALAMVVSDRLYAISALLPMVGLAVLPVLDRRVRARTALIALGVLAGSEAWRWFAGKSDVVSRYGPVKSAPESAAQMASDFATLFGSHALASAIMVAALCALGAALVRAWRVHRSGADPDSTDTARAAAAVFIAGAVMLPLAASVALGRHTGLDSFRYAQTLLLPLLPLAWWLADALARRAGVRAAWAAYALLALVTALAAVRLDTSERALRAEWRGQADCIDRVHAEHGLHHGLSRYWHANALTAMLASGAPVFSVSADLVSVPINKNIDWIGARARDAAAMPVIDFIDEYQFDTALLDRAFGVPRARVQCPLSTVRVYAPDDGVLGALYRANDWLPQDTLQRYGDAALPGSLWAQPPARIQGDAMRVDGTFARPQPVLIGAVESRHAVTRLWFDYRLSGAPADARWEVVALDAQGRTLDVLATGVLPHADSHTHHEIDIPRPKATPHGIGVSLAVRGDVALEVRALGMSSE